VGCSITNPRGLVVTCKVMGIQWRDRKKNFVGDFHLSWLFIRPSPHPPPTHPTSSTGRVPLHTTSSTPSRPSSLSIHKTLGRTAWRRQVARVSVDTPAAHWHVHACPSVTPEEQTDRPETTAHEINQISERTSAIITLKDGQFPRDYRSRFNSLGDGRRKSVGGRVETGEMRTM
jgi:hypothetical protein